MSNIKKEISSFEEYLKIYIKGKKVQNITHKYLSNTNNDKNYDDYTIEHFWALYKLNRMEELGVINERISNELKEILDMKRHINVILGEETRKEFYNPLYKSADLPKLHKSLDTINNHLKKYHLTADDISLTDIIDLSIKIENNLPINESKNIRVKRID